MKLVNTLDGFSNKFLRRMVSWCCKEIGMPVRLMRKATFRNRNTRAYSGLGGSREIIASVGRDKHFPLKPDNRPGMQGEIIADRVEALVAITAHELYHVAAQSVSQHRQRTRGKGRWCNSSERRTRFEEVRVLRLFRQQREELLAAWNGAGAAGEEQEPMAMVAGGAPPVRHIEFDEPVAVAAGPSQEAKRAERLAVLKEKRAAKAAAMLATWQRRHKAAANKVRKYKQRVRYYEKQAAGGLAMAAAGQPKGGK